MRGVLLATLFCAGWFEERELREGVVNFVLTVSERVE